MFEICSVRKIIFAKSLYRSDYASTFWEVEKTLKLVMSGSVYVKDLSFLQEIRQNV